MNVSIWDGCDSYLDFDWHLQSQQWHFKEDYAILFQRSSKEQKRTLQNSFYTGLCITYSFSVEANKGQK